MSPSPGGGGCESGNWALSLARTDLEVIRRHCEGGYAEEVCGGLLGRKVAERTIEVVEAVVIDNQRPDERGRRYLIGPSDVVSLERRADAEGLEVVGYYHSHPDAPARPSEFDREHAWPWYVYVIVSVANGGAVEARAWRLAEDRSAFRPVSINDSETVSLEVE